METRAGDPTLNQPTSAVAFHGPAERDQATQQAGAEGTLRFADVIDRYRRPLTAAAMHLCGDRESAQDAVQETFLAAFQCFSRLRDPDRAGAWLYAILKRKAADARRKCRDEAPIPDEFPAPPEEGADALVSAVVRDQLANLSREDREILAGHYLMGLSYREIGEALGIREGTVRVRCYRAKERMRILLQGAGVKGGSAR